MGQGDENAALQRLCGRTVMLHGRLPAGLFAVKRVIGWVGFMHCIQFCMHKQTIYA